MKNGQKLLPKIRKTSSFIPLAWSLQVVNKCNVYSHLNHKSLVQHIDNSLVTGVFQSSSAVA